MIEKRVDFALEQFARPVHQDAVLLHRLDQRDQRGDVVGLGFANVFQRFAGDHGADTIVREQLAQQRAVLFEADQVHPADAGRGWPARRRAGSV
jgi:hypothetical protein